MTVTLRTPCLLAILVASLPAASVKAQAAGGVYPKADVMQIAHRLEAEFKAKPDHSGVLEEPLSKGTEVAVRLMTGRAEFHQNAADVFIVLSGEATLVSGGTIVNPQGSDEIRGDSITNGTSAVMHQGDVVYVPPATAHQVQLKPGAAFLYLIVKVARKD
jgi:mannose-6-phosphate isomerase-like protein (cupin superfamily)